MSDVSENKKIRSEGKSLLAGNSNNVEGGSGIFAGVTVYDSGMIEVE